MNISNDKIVNSQNSLHVGSKQYHINSKGYLINFNDWDKGFSKKVAEIDHITLTQHHWEAINFLRNFYSEYGVAPTPHIVIKTIGDKINSYERCTHRDINNVFPLGGCKHACRLAGLPLHYCYAC